jgi:phosphate starvation-inducible PhoH-like protein
VLKGVEGISFVKFDERDVVRHPLVQRIVRAYERYNEISGAGRQLSLKLSDSPLDTPAEAAAEAPMTPMAASAAAPVLNA